MLVFNFESQVPMIIIPIEFQSRNHSFIITLLTNARYGLVIQTDQLIKHVIDLAGCRFLDESGIQLVSQSLTSLRYQCNVKKVVWKMAYLLMYILINYVVD